MLIEKTFHFERCDGFILEPIIFERIEESNLTFTWDSALLLAAYLMTIEKEVEERVVLEIGAGTGLPSVLCGLLNAKRVVATERADEPILLENLRSIMTANSITNAIVAPLSWDSLSLEHVPVLDDSIDIVLGADVLYSTEDFDPVMALFAELVERNPAAVFVTTYKNRSARRTLSPYLDLYGLSASEIPLSSFLGTCHTIGCCVTTTARPLFDTRDGEIVTDEAVVVNDSGVPDTISASVSVQWQGSDSGEEFREKEEGSVCKKKRLNDSYENVESVDNESIDDHDCSTSIRENIPCFDDIFLLRIYRPLSSFM